MGRYIVQPASSGGFRIIDEEASMTLDMHLLYSAAEYFTRMLNAGQAAIDMHASIGSRVQPND